MLFYATHSHSRHVFAIVNHVFNLLKFIKINSIHDIAKVFTLVVDFTFYLQLLSCVFFPPLMFPLIKYVEEETQDPSNIGTDNDPGAKPTKVGTTTYIVLTRVWNPMDFQGHRSKVKVPG